MDAFGVYDKYNDFQKLALILERKSARDLRLPFDAGAASSFALRNLYPSKVLFKSVAKSAALHAARVAAVIIKILFHDKKRERGKNRAISVTSPLRRVKAFPFNYNRSIPARDRLRHRHAGRRGSGERFYRRSATAVRTSALKPPLKFAELFICLSRTSLTSVPVS